MMITVLPGLFVVMCMVLILLFAVVTAKQGGRTMLILMAAGLAMLVALLVGWTSLSREEALVTSRSLSTESTEQMWERLHKPRIPMSSTAVQTKTAKSADLSNVYDEVLEAYQTKATEATKQAILKVAQTLQAEQALSKTQLVAVQNEVEVATAESEKRPAWVDLSPKRIGNVYREVIVSGPYTQAAECHRELDQRVRQVVSQRVEQLVGHNYYPGLEGMGLNLDYVWDEICREEWVEDVDSSVGEMKRVHVLMEFDAAVDKRLQEAYRGFERSHRIEEVSGVVAIALAILVGVYGLLRVDTWTRGYYTKRLFFGVPAAIIILLIVFNS